MKHQHLLSILISSVLILCSCSKDPTLDIKSSDADIIAFALVEQIADIDIDRENSKVDISFTPDVTYAEDFVFEFILSQGAVAKISSIQLISGAATYDFDAPFIINVIAENRIDAKQWRIIPTNNIIDISWGLGGFEKQTLSNNRDYDWYLDQSVTGTYASINCGPTSTTMAAKWSNENFSLTPEDARAAYRPEGGWWYTSDIDSYLNDYGIPHHFISLSDNYSGTSDILKQNIDAGNIAILCLDMYYIRNGSTATQHVDKFYATASSGWGHFIVVKGYKEVDGQYFFEAYDPFCFDKKYSDGSFKGKDRYYRAIDLYEATSIWWNYSIILTPQGSKSIVGDALDPSTIPHARGK